MMTAKALVLDFGGVISRTVFETHSDSEAALGLEPGTLQWRGPFDPGTDPLWLKMQAGEISERDYWYHRARETGALVGESWESLPAFLQRIRGAEPNKIIRPEAIAAISAAANTNCKLAILSNELDLFYGTGFTHRLEILKGFDLIIDATYTNILKPDPRAYAFVIDGLGIAANQCVFIDDQLKNIIGAKAAGMQTIHFDVTNPGKGFDEALNLLGLTPNKENSHDVARQ